MTGNASVRAGGNRPLIVVPDDIVGRLARSPETDRLREAADVVLHPTRPSGPDDLADRIRDADIVLSFRPAFTRFPEDVLRAAPRLRYLCIAGAGVDDVDVTAASGLGIAVGRGADHRKRAMVEHCLALMLDVARQLSLQDRRIRAGEWQPLPGFELEGKTLGILGLSAIARELVPLARALGMTVVSWSRDNDPARAAAIGSRAAPLDEVLAAADVLSLHIRLAPELHRFLDAAKIARMKAGAVLINTARGELVDDDALAAALASGRLRGAGLDVFSAAPLPPDHPFRRLDNVVMSPTAAWNTDEAAARNVRRAVDNVLGYLAGRPAELVNETAPEVARTIREGRRA